MLVQETDMLEVFILTKVMRSFSPEVELATSIIKNSYIYYKSKIEHKEQFRAWKFISKGIVMTYFN